MPIKKVPRYADKEKRMNTPKLQMLLVEQEVRHAA